MDICQCRRILSEAGIRRAIDEHIPLVRGPVQMSKPWEDTWSLSGNRAIIAQFRCDLCKAVHNVYVEEEPDEEEADDPDPADWWKG